MVTADCFLPGRAEYLSAPQVFRERLVTVHIFHHNHTWSALGLSPDVCDDRLVTGSRTVRGLIVDFVRICVIK